MRDLRAAGAAVRRAKASGRSASIRAQVWEAWAPLFARLVEDLIEAELERHLVEKGRVGVRQNRGKVEDAAREGKRREERGAAGAGRSVRSHHQRAELLRLLTVRPQIENLHARAFLPQRVSPWCARG